MAEPSPEPHRPSQRPPRDPPDHRIPSNKCHPMSHPSAAELRSVLEKFSAVPTHTRPRLTNVQTRFAGWPQTASGPVTQLLMIHPRAVLPSISDGRARRPQNGRIIHAWLRPAAPLFMPCCSHLIAFLGSTFTSISLRTPFPSDSSFCLFISLLSASVLTRTYIPFSES